MALPKELSTIKRFGPRYGRTTRHKIGLIEHAQRQKHKCPYCMQLRVQRLAAGIWQCRKCNAQFTGKAYLPAKKKMTAQELITQIATQEPAETHTPAVEQEAEVIEAREEQTVSQEQ